MSAKAAEHVSCEQRYHALVYKEEKEYEMFCRVLDKDKRQMMNELTKSERLFRRKYSFLLSRRQQMENPVTNENGLSRSERLKRMISFEVSKSSSLKERIEAFFEKLHFPVRPERNLPEKEEEEDDSISEVYDLKEESRYRNNKLLLPPIRRSSFPAVRPKKSIRRQSLFKSQFRY